MHDAHIFLQTLALVFCVAAVATVLFHRLRQPIVFGYLLAGMVVGPHVPLPLAADEPTVRILSELGVILLMFSLGLEFRLQRVIAVAGTSGLGALAETSTMLGLGFLAGRALGWTSVESLFTGGIVAISSTTIITKTFAEHRVVGRVRDVVFGFLIVEDLIAIVLVAVLTAVATLGTVSADVVGATALRLATFLAALIGIGIFVVPRLVRLIVRAGSREMTLVGSIGICFAAALAALSFGYSVALGAFIAGSLVAESGEGKTIEHLVEPVRDLFFAIFFVSVGMLIDPRVIAQHWPAVLALTVVVIVGKIVAVGAGAFFSGNGLRTSVQTGMSLAQIGEFSFIIAAVGTATGAIGSHLYQIAVAVSAITTLTTPLLIRAAAPAAVLLDRALPAPVQTFVSLYGSWIERLRQSGPASGGRARLRRLVRLLALDAVLLAVVLVGVALEMDRFEAVLGTLLAWPAWLARTAVLTAAGLVVMTLVIGLVRLAGRLAMALAVQAVPMTDRGKVDFARAPRTVLVVTLQMGILLAIVAPVMALLQPFLTGTPTVLVLLAIVLLLAVAFWRAARDLHGHAKAGAQVIGMALTEQLRTAPDADLTSTMEQIGVRLPGLGEPTPITVAQGSAVLGSTIRQLNLHGSTGAAVLCVVRRDGAHEESEAEADLPLRVGDTVVVAGSHEALDAARAMLR